MNDCSNRQTPTVVGYTDTNRQLGEAGLAQHVGNWKNTVVDLKRVVGGSWTDAEFVEDVKRLPFKVEQEGNDGVVIEVMYGGEKVRLSPEQVTGAMFTHLKVLAERVLEGQKVMDCVIAVPHYFTDRMRRGVLDAAKIAGLNVLRLLNEGTAIALQYGLLRSLPESNPIKVMFFDLGHTHTTVTLTSFIAGSLTILATSCLRNVGSRDFDRVIVKKIAEYALDKYRLDILSNVKATLRLTKQSEKIKKMLSANLEAPYNIECIMNDVDVKGSLNREEFEALSVELLEKILIPVKDVLASAQIDPKDLDAVEIVGGGSRIPSVRRALKEYLGKDLSTTNNADESVARGCALQCAMLSPNVRVREFSVTDVSLLPITVGWNNLGNAAEDESVVLFSKYNPIPSIKQIQFSKTAPFQLNVRYNSTDLALGLNPLIGTFIIRNIPEYPTKQKLKIKLDANGLISINSAQTLEELKEENGSETPMEVEAADPKEDAGDDKKKKKYKRTDLPFESLWNGGLSEKEIIAGVELEATQAGNDRLISETAEKRNELEAFIYDTRTNIQGSWSVYWKESAINGLSKLLDDGEEWLQTDEGEHSQKSEYVRRLAEFKAKFEPMYKRKYEAENRDQAITDLKNTLTKFKLLASSPDPKYAHISAEEKNTAFGLVDEASQSLQAALEKQQGLSKSDDPFITVAQILEKKSAVEKKCDAIFSKPAPKPAPVPVPSAPANTAAPPDANAGQTKGEAPAAGAEGKKESEMELD